MDAQEKPDRLTSETVKRLPNGKIDMSQFDEDDLEQMRRTMMKVDALLVRVKKRLQEENSETFK